MQTSMTPEAVTGLIDAYYRGDDLPEGERGPWGEARPTGGNLHIVLDDGNVSDDDVLFCLRQAEREDDQAGVALAEALLGLDQPMRDAVVSGEYS